MFHTISNKIKSQMSRLERIDSEDRQDGTPRLKRLRQIPPETGRFIALMAANIPEGQIIEIGTSAGYSTLWLFLAAKLANRRVTTFEILEEKIKLAKETFKLAEVEDTIELISGDALDYLDEYIKIAFCFLDAEKEIYEACYDAVVPNMISGGYLIADNAINHRKILQPMINRALHDSRVDSMVVTVGKGLLVCRKL